MRRVDSLYRDFKKIKREPNEHRRGLLFEELVGQLFARAHYRVQRGPGAARPRQTDLFASKNHDDYLVETKWQKDPLDISDLDNLKARLDRISHQVVGMLFSKSGFTKETIADLETHRQCVILLCDADEIDLLFGAELDLDSLIREKRDSFVRDGRVLFCRASSSWSNRQTPDRTALAAPDLRIVTLKDNVIPWIAGAGDFGHSVFTQELPDVDWIGAQGFAVGFDLHIRKFNNRTDLAYTIDILREMGWISSAGRYTIHQAEVCWQGTGAAGFLDAIDAWESRYKKVTSRLHHTEEATYFDICDHGFFTLTADISPDTDRVYSAELSAQLYGIPMDTEQFRALARTFGAGDFTYFRPLGKRTSHVCRWFWGSHKLEPVAFLCSDENWVGGIVAKNPFHRVRGTKSKRELILDKEFEPLRDFELLCCRLGSWHERGDKVDYYFLRDGQMTWTEDTAVFSISANWHKLMGRKHPFLSRPRAVTVEEVEESEGG